MGVAVWACAFALVGAGCGPFGRLPTTEQEPFQECRDYMLAAICGAPGQNCLAERDAADRYALLQRADRAAWLHSMGCPSAVAGYAPSAPRADRPRIITPPGFEEQEPVLPPARPATATLEADRDEFDGRVTVRYRVRFYFDDHRGRGVPGTFSIYFHVDSGDIGIGITTANDRWRYMECPSIDMLVDGAPAEVTNEEHRGEVGRGRSVHVIESVIGDANAETLRRLSTATTVRLRICRDTFSIRPEDVRILHGFAGHLRPAPIADPPAPVP